MSENLLHFEGGVPTVPGKYWSEMSREYSKRKKDDGGGRRGLSIGS